MAENVKGLSIKLGLDTTALQQGVSQVQKNIKKLNGLQKTFNKISGSIVAIGTAMLATASKVSQAINEVDDSASRAGVGLEQWQRLSFALDQVGVDSATTSSAMAKMNSAIAKVASGSGKDLVGILNKLGIDSAEFVKMSPDEAFYTLNEAMGGVEDNATKLSYMTEFFGDKLTTKLLPAVSAGSEELQKLGESAVVFTEEQGVMAKKTETLQKQIRQTAVVIGASLLPIVNEILTAVKGFVEKIAPKIQGFFDKINGLSSTTKGLIGVLAGVGASLAPVLKIGTSIYKLVGVLMPKAMTALMAHPIIAGIGAVLAVLTTLYTTNEDFRKSVDELFKTLGEALKPLMSLLNQVLKPIANLLSGVIGKVLKLLATALTPIVDGFTKLISILTPFIDFMDRVLKPILELAYSVFNFLTFGGLDALSKAINGFEETTSTNNGGNLNSGDPTDVDEYVNYLLGHPSVPLKESRRDAYGQVRSEAPRIYNITINTSADHMSLDEIDQKLGLAY